MQFKKKNICKQVIHMQKHTRTHACRHTDRLTFHFPDISVKKRTRTPANMQPRSTNLRLTIDSRLNKIQKIRGLICFLIVAIWNRKSREYFFPSTSPLLPFHLPPYSRHGWALHRLLHICTYLRRVQHASVRVNLADLLLQKAFQCQWTS